MSSQSTFFNRITDSSLCELVGLFGDKIPAPDIDKSSRNRVFDPWRTFWLFLYQILSYTQSCREAVRNAQSWLYLTSKKKSLLTTRHIVKLDQNLNSPTWIKLI